jgi:hypothetical protein
VLGDRGEACLHLGTAGGDHRGEAVGAPLAGRAPEAPHDGVHGLYEMSLVHRLREHSAGATRVRKRPQEHIGRLSPRGLAPFEPVPLDLFAGGVIDLDRLAAFYRLYAFEWGELVRILGGFGRDGQVTPPA